MYFWTTLLLILTYVFTCFLQPQSPSEDEVPFEYKYTLNIEHFLVTVTKDFKISLGGKLKILLINAIEFDIDNDTNVCTIERIRKPPFYRLARNSNPKCERLCLENNKKYVKFLNKHIYKLKTFLKLSMYTVKLNPVSSGNGRCVENKKSKNPIFECVCDPKHQIIINIQLNIDFLDIVNQELDLIQNIGPVEHFCAFIILLKFFPQTAPFYLAYLFEKYNISEDRLISVPKQQVDFSGQVVPENARGLVENRGQFSWYGRKMFDQIYDLIANKPNINAIGRKYYNKNYAATWAFAVLYILFTFNMLSNTVRDLSES